MRITKASTHSGKMEVKETKALDYHHLANSLHEHRSIPMAARSCQFMHWHVVHHTSRYNTTTKLRINTSPIDPFPASPRN
jgi:hypothetical protein